MASIDDVSKMSDTFIREGYDGDMGSLSELDLVDSGRLVKAAGGRTATLMMAGSLVTPDPG